MDILKQENLPSKSVNLDSTADGFSVIPELKWIIYFTHSFDQMNDSPSTLVHNFDFLSENFSSSNFKNSNQYKIATANSIQPLIIPLVKGSKDVIWKQKRISYDHNWIKEHKNALQTAYGKSPFFEFYDYKLFGIFDSRPQYLWELNQKIMNMILPYLGFNLAELKNSRISSIKFNSVDQIGVRSNEAETTPLNQFNFSFDSASLPITIKIPEYTQVFDVKFGFQSDVCILDLLFNLGPLSNEYFKKL